jgi:hypothetical protein
MSDWDFLNKHRLTRPPWISKPSDGFNGAFEFQVLGRPIRVIASDGEGWEHVSVSQSGSHKPPSWDVMSAVKNLFWEEDQCAIEFHPPRKDYVNNHPGCLHLWRPTDGRFPRPPANLVGWQEMGVISSKADKAAAFGRYLEANAVKH